MKKDSSKAWDEIIKDSGVLHTRDNSKYEYKTYLGMRKEILMRDVHNLSELSGKSGIHVDRTTLSKYIKGEKIPPVDVVMRLALYCNVTIDELLIPLVDKDYYPPLSHIKQLIKLNKDYTYEVMKENGKTVEIDLSKYSNAYNYNVFKLDFDSVLLKAFRGSLVLTNFDIEEFDGKSKKEFFAILLDKTMTKKVEVKRNDKTFYRSVPVERLYPSVVKVVKNDDDLVKVAKNIVSYTDVNGETQLTTLKNFNKTYHSRIERIIRDL